MPLTDGAYGGNGAFMSYKRAQVNIKGEILLVSRIVMAGHLKRKLKPSEIVHHKDHDPFNNDISNLQLTTRSEHKRLHPEIGMKTRLKKIWYIDSIKLLKILKNNSPANAANILGCSPKTIERELRKIGCCDLRKFNQNQNGKVKYLTTLIKEIKNGK